MARIRAFSGERRVRLDRGWRMMLAPDAGRPSDAADWIDAPVPGTAAQAIENAGVLTPELAATLQARHIWYKCELPAGPPALLRFQGLAPHGEIHLGDRCVARAEGMFDPVEAMLESVGKTTLCLYFPPLAADAAAPAPRRQRWRPRLIASPQMRTIRASLLGHMPGWCPAIQPVGPYRPVEIVTQGPVEVSGARVRTTLEGTTGIVEISIEIKGMDGPFVASCWSAAAPMSRGADGRWRARLDVANPPLWWPHTHGDPHRLPLTIHGPEDGEGEPFLIDLGHVGFRSIGCDRGPDGDGFALRINGVDVFCRGANWTNADLLRLPGEAADYEPLIRRARDAGMNMLRISGVMTRESPEFFDLCDRYGILVWLDEALANFDYDFNHLVNHKRLESSLRDYLRGIEAAPSLAVVCGGSEMAQQGAMLSLPESVWTSDWCTTTLPQLVADIRPDVIVVPNSPWGGALPFQPDKGVSHYYGVGAYMRPLEDARRANVRFATECLAFAQLPQPERMAANAGDARPGDEAWKRRVVRDLGADWDFEDTRDFYLGLLYGVDPARLRAEEPDRYVALSQAVPGEAMEATFAEWRRVGSVTRGGLVWFLGDLGPGFGWGVIDWQGAPKPAYHALRRAFRPVSVLITDEGLNGLRCHVLNERRDSPLAARLTLTAYAADGGVVIDGARDVALPGGGSLSVESAELFGIFFDVTCAYRFGAPAHVVTVARLSDAQSGAFLAEAFHFPLGRGHARRADLGLAAEVVSDGQWRHALRLTTRAPAQSVHIACEGFEPADDWFHLAPGEGRLVALKGRGRPAGHVAALNGAGPVAFG